MAITDSRLDGELEALLRAEGIDPERALARRARLAAFKRTPEEEAKLAAERAELREANEDYNAFVAANGLLSDHTLP